MFNEPYIAALICLLFAAAVIALMTKNKAHDPTDRSKGKDERP